MKTPIIHHTCEYRVKTLQWVHTYAMRYDCSNTGEVLFFRSCTITDNHHTDKSIRTAVCALLTAWCNKFNHTLKNKDMFEAIKNIKHINIPTQEELDEPI